jgi:hypothetical protein
MANSYKRYPVTLTAATPATLFTVPAATTAIVRSIWVTNSGGASATIKVSFAPGGSGLHYLTFNTTVNAGEYYDLIGTKPTGPLILETGDIFRIESSASSVGVVVSALLVDRN